MSEDFSKLRKQLELQEWPGVYFYKFIIPNDSEKLAKTTALFNDSVDLAFKESKSGKYISVSAKEMMLSIDEVISKYQEATKIKGLISL